MFTKTHPDLIFTNEVVRDGYTQEVEVCYNLVVVTVPGRYMVSFTTVSEQARVRKVKLQKGLKKM